MLRQVFPGQGVQHTPPPSLHLNFLSESMDPRVTFSGGAGGTRINSTGTLVSASAPRFDYDPVALACKGLLIEEQRTNLLLQSEALNVTWTKTGASVTADAIAAPSGLVTADKLVEDTSAASHAALQTFSFITGTVYAYSAYVKAAERTKVLLQVGGAPFGGTAQGVRFDLGAVTATTTAGSATGSIAAVGNGWYRVSVVLPATTSSTAANCNIFLCDATGNNVYTGDGASGAYAWGVQLEAGAFSDGYIPDTTVAITRTPDLGLISGSAFSAAVNGNAGAVIAEFTIPQLPSTNNSGVFEIDNGTFGEALALYVTSAGTVRGVVRSGGSQIALLDVASAAINTVIRAGIAWGPGYFAVSSRGSAAVTAPSTLPVGVNRMTIGDIALGQKLNGDMRKLRTYPALSVAALNLLTT